MSLRPDLQAIAEMVEPGTRVLDIGCGDGALLKFLASERAIDARGMELSQAGVNACVANGLSVVQGMPIAIWPIIQPVGLITRFCPRPCRRPIGHARS